MIRDATSNSWVRLVNLPADQIFLEYQSPYNSRYIYAGTARYSIDQFNGISGRDQAGVNRAQNIPANPLL